MLSFVLRGIFPIGAFAWHWFDWLVLKIYLGRLAKTSQVKESKIRSIHFPLQVLNAMEDATKLWMWLYLLRWIEFGSSTVLGTAHLVTMSILVQTKQRNRANSEFKLKQESNVLCLKKTGPNKLSALVLAPTCCVNSSEPGAPPCKTQNCCRN